MNYFYLKDFFWWLTKENLLTNLLYRKLGPIVFKPFGYNTCELKDKPVIQKQNVVSEGYTSQNARRCAIKGYTSGTTNSPMTVYRSIRSIILEEYVLKSYLEKNGIPLRPRVAVLRGDNVCPAERKAPPFWIKLPFTRRLIMSSFHISLATAGDYFRVLEKTQPHLIMAYPSSIYILSKFAITLGWKPNWNLCGVLASSETFSSESIEVVESIFGNVYDHYGQAERVAVLQRCSSGRYHVRNDYSHVEFLSDENGVRIVGTNVHNKCMPLFRYDTRDYVENLVVDGSCSCGDNSASVERILGRDDDFLVLPDGRHVGRIDSVFKNILGLIECQVEQDRSDRLIIRYVPDFSVNPRALEENILVNLALKLGSAFRVKFVEVECLPKTRSGKFRSVIRNVNIV